MEDSALNAALVFDAASSLDDFSSGAIEVSQDPWLRQERIVGKSNLVLCAKAASQTPFDVTTQDNVGLQSILPHKIKLDKIESDVSSSVGSAVSLQNADRFSERFPEHIPEHFFGTEEIASLWAKVARSLMTSLDSQIFAAWIRPLYIGGIKLVRQPVGGSAGNQVVPSSNKVLSNAEDASPNAPRCLTVRNVSEHSQLRVEICTPNKFCREHVEKYYGRLMTDILADELSEDPQLISVVFSVASHFSSSNSNNNGANNRAEPRRNSNQRPRSTSHSSLSAVESAEMSALSGVSAAVEKSQKRSPVAGRVERGRSSSDNYDRTNLNNNYNFSNFVVGACNQFSHAVSLQVAQNPGLSYNPLFLYGGVGLGKTHLVNAIGNHARRQGRNVLLVTSEFFVNELIGAIRSNKMSTFREKFRSLDLLIIDDIQFLIGKERTQEEFFHTFNNLHQHRKQIVITSDKVPQDLVGLEERLRTRFASGVSADLQAPDYETRVAILVQKAEALALKIPNEVVTLLAEKIDSNIRELEGALNRLHAFSAMHNRAIDISLAHEALRAYLPDCIQELSVEYIQETIAKKYCVSRQDILGKRRTQNIALARQIGMYVCRKMLGSSYPEIGVYFGGRDHSTIIHACKAVEEKLTADPALSADIVNLEKRLRNSSV